MSFPYQVNMALSRSQAAAMAPVTYYAAGTPVDLSSADALATFQNVQTGNIDLVLTVGFGIALGGPSGTITVSLTAGDAAQLTGEQYEYDLQLDLG